ncbi:hypothetical protein [Specibacter cremeus]|uniref:hypothetical protein n=1 Tax=Specibacter cremeus TaxID=1629051 RepID=UPI000F7B670C|nr:hypothetical protein [Specibacter cremeus]
MSDPHAFPDPGRPDRLGRLPGGGFSGLFSVRGLPSLLKISYILWLVSAGFWLIGTFFLFLISLFTFSGRGLASAIVSLALIAAILVLLLKLKEGRQWARMALSVIAALTIVLTFFGAGTGLLGVVATILMWLPESSAWLEGHGRAT